MNEINCIDKNGEVIYSFTQWDSGQTFMTDITGLDEIDKNNPPMVHFCNHKSENAYIIQSTISGNVLSAPIPNILFTMACPLIIYIYDEGKTIYKSFIPIEPRIKPDDYIFEDDYIDFATKVENMESQLEALKNHTHTRFDNDVKIGSNYHLQTGQIWGDAGIKIQNKSDTANIQISSGSDNNPEVQIRTILNDTTQGRIVFEKIDDDGYNKLLAAFENFKGIANYSSNIFGFHVSVPMYTSDGISTSSLTVRNDLLMTGGTITSHNILPSENGVYDLGNSTSDGHSLRWKNVYAVNVDTDDLTLSNAKQIVGLGVGDLSLVEYIGYIKDNKSNTDHTHTEFNNSVKISGGNHLQIQYILGNRGITINNNPDNDDELGKIELGSTGSIELGYSGKLQIGHMVQDVADNLMSMVPDINIYGNFAEIKIPVGMKSSLTMDEIIYAENIVPREDNRYDLGNKSSTAVPDRRWKNIYAVNVDVDDLTLSYGTKYIDSTVIGSGSDIKLSEILEGIRDGKYGSSGTVTGKVATNNEVDEMLKEVFKASSIR